MAALAVKKSVSWPNLGEDNESNPSQAQRILHLRDISEALKQFAIEIPKRKASASYVSDLASSMLEIVDMFVGLPELGQLDERVTRIDELAKQTNEDVSYIKQLTQLLRHRPTTSSAKDWRGTRKWIMELITTGLATSLPAALNAATPITATPQSLSASLEDDNDLRLRFGYRIKLLSKI
ncbi:hypothetical protein MMC22_007242 [Lobaria immixta]|nr:hypothetical protein [Lobaria immixta]